MIMNLSFKNWVDYQKKRKLENNNIQAIWFIDEYETKQIVTKLSTYGLDWIAYNGYAFYLIRFRSLVNLVSSVKFNSISPIPEDEKYNLFKA